jgi:hypothetical protein
VESSHELAAERDNVSKFLVTTGVLLVVLGLAWPWLAKLGLGRLPGDIVIEKDGLRFYFPITTAILVSLVISVLLLFFRK